MTWTATEVGTWREINDAKLAEINATLRPDSVKGSGKVGIFCTGQVGDLATITSVLKYRSEVFGTKEIIFFTNWPNADLLRYAPIDEVRMWPWANNGLPDGCPDFYPLLCTADNRLNLDKAKDFELTADLTDGYFPAPHQMTPDQRHGIDYPNCSRKVFGISADKEWHPVLSWSEDEENLSTLPLAPKRKTIMLETFFGSGQSKWDDLMTVKTIEICREAWGACNFLFASHKNTGQFKDFEGYRTLDKLTPREAALYIDHCDLFVGVSSGMSVTTSAWGLKPVPKVQFCGSQTCSTVALSLGEISLITSDNKLIDQSKKEFYIKLKEVISRIQ